MDEKRWAQLEAEARRAEAWVFWEETFRLIGTALSSWQTYVIALTIWILIAVF